MQSIKIIFVLLLSFASVLHAEEDAQKLIDKVVTANGGMKTLKALKDVSYEYTFRSKEKGIVDVSIERYIFDGEISYAQYTDRQYFALPEMKGIHTQFFDGKTTVSKLDGKIISDQQPAYVGHFFRKTNFYWFNMMFKLSDPGVNHKVMPERKVNGTTYKIVEMTFGENIGDTKDKYVLYINPKTNRVDQFLFTVLGFGFKDPFLMKLDYEQINGIWVSTYRKYAPADWDGNVIKEEWNEQISKNIKFNNGFSLENIQSSFLEQSISATQKINMPAKDVWRLVSDWNKLNQFVPKVVDRTEVNGKGLDTNWTIFLKNGKLVKEVMTAYSDKKMSMSYKMTETPMPLRDYLATIKVRPIDLQSSEVTFATDFKVKEENRANLLATFETFQNTYLSNLPNVCLLYTSPSPRDATLSRMPSSA